MKAQASHGRQLLEIASPRTTIFCPPRCQNRDVHKIRRERCPPASPVSVRRGTVAAAACSMVVDELEPTKKTRAAPPLNLCDPHRTAGGWRTVCSESCEPPAGGVRRCSRRMSMTPYVGPVLNACWKASTSTWTCGHPSQRFATEHDTLTHFFPFRHVQKERHTITWEQHKADVKSTSAS